MEAIKELKRARARVRKKAPPEVIAEAAVSTPKKKARAKVKHEITVEVPKVPYGCVYHKKIGSYSTCYIIELPEQMKAVKYYPKKYVTTADELFLSWPRTLWVIVLKNASRSYPPSIAVLYLVATTTPFDETGLKTKTYIFPMPNVGNNHRTPGMLCMGQSLAAIDATNPVQYVNECMLALLSSKWNEGIRGRYEAAGITSLADWHDKSKADPEFYKKLIMSKDILTDVGELLKEIEALYRVGGEEDE